MNIRLELKIVLGMVFALMLGGTALADSVSTYEGNNVTDARDFAFGVPTSHGWEQGINPCNCNPDGHFVRNELGKRSGWSFTAGSYTVTVPAAEPATGLFVGLGLAVVGLMRRRRKKPLENTVWETLG
jgi:MYXO-CTERM domain-containing protein